MRFRSFITAFLLMGTCAVCTMDIHAQMRSNLVMLQGVIDGMETEDQWRQGTEVLKNHADVTMVRLCPHTKNLMMHVSVEHGLDRTAINALWAGFGMAVRCVRFQDQEQPFRHLDPATCEALPEQR